MLLSKEEQELEVKKNRRRFVQTCKKCGGTGFLTRMNNGYEESYPCSCLKVVKRNVKLLDWGVPRKFLNDKWNMDFLKEKPYYQDIKNYIDNFQENYDNGKGLFLYGPQGRGKTTVESIIAKEVVMMVNPDTFSKKQTFNVAFAMYDDIVKKQFDKEQSQLKYFLYKSDLLIIDNVGNETGKNEKQFSQRILEMILRKRDNDCLPTILSSNYNIDEMATEYNNDVRDFILQNDKLVSVLGDNHRIENCHEEYDDTDF
jgi:DNA replication protein DnaC